MLQKMCNVVHEVVRQLRALQYPLEGTHIFFVHGIHERLDYKTAKAWELSRTSQNPTTSEMLNFLDRQARALPSLSTNSSKENRKRGATDNKNRPSPKKSKSSGFKERRPTKNSGKKICKVCQNDYPVNQCTTFKGRSLSNKRKAAQEYELCYNCLHPGHSSRVCRSAGCKRCNKKHNSLC